MRLVELAIHAQRQCGLRLEISLTRRDARVLLDLEGHLERFPRDGEPDAVCARGHLRTGELRLERIPRPALALDLRRVGIAHVPEEAVQPRHDRDLRILGRWWLHGALRRRLLRWLGLLERFIDRLRVALEISDRFST